MPNWCVVGAPRTRLRLTLISRAVYSRSRYQRRLMDSDDNPPSSVAALAQDVKDAEDWHKAYGKYMIPGADPPRLPDVEFHT